MTIDFEANNERVGFLAVFATHLADSVLPIAIVYQAVFPGNALQASMTASSDQYSRIKGQLFLAV
ncbi:hypothetical protein [Arboricoccus pini]|uniref:hypothetical protein n=1 Tax=Arboricoccus pini TaxID=1963835 RepID=UPI000B50B812|nr:hypothetical protein [Arboricoccus pini]